MKTSSFLSRLGKLVPNRLAAEHDYIGLNAGTLPKKINKILLCLDFDYEVLDEALKYRPDLIISHHPFIYGKKSEVFYLWHYKKDLYEQINDNHLCVYAYHTNFDACRNGMNDVAARMLKLVNIYSPSEEKMMRIGELETPMEINQFAQYVKNTFSLSYALLINEGKKLIKKVGLILGGGSGYYKLAKEEGCDIYISGDAPHHVRRNIVNDKYNYLDVPHEIEAIFMPAMEKLIKQINSNIEIISIDHEKLPKVI